MHEAQDLIPNTKGGGRVKEEGMEEKSTEEKKTEEIKNQN